MINQLLPVLCVIRKITYIICMMIFLSVMKINSEDLISMKQTDEKTESELKDKDSILAFQP